MRKKAPERTGKCLSYPTLPSPEHFNLHIPYWRDDDETDKKKGLLPLIQFSIEGYKIFKDMIEGGTFENCFHSQEANGIGKNVVYPISTRSKDRSQEAIGVSRKYPERFIPFCSVHPFDSDAREKIFHYKTVGAKGFKLKITDLELKNDLTPLIDLCKICYEARLPVVFHTGSIESLKQENCSPLLWKLYKSTRVEIFAELLSHLPEDFVFIFGHCGIQEYKTVAEHLKRYPASYAEVSTQSAESIRYIIDQVGSERILFGSDWPALPQALTLSRVLEATEDSPEARKNILSKNAKKILYSKKFK